VRNLSFYQETPSGIVRWHFQTAMGPVHSFTNFAGADVPYQAEDRGKNKQFCSMTIFRYNGKIMDFSQPG